MRYVLILIVIGLIAAGCSGGGSGSSFGGVVSPVSTSHAPALSGLNLYPTSVNQYDGNGTIQVDFSFTVTDSGGDLASVFLTLYDNTGAILDSYTESIQDSAGITNGVMSGYINADTQVAGNYKIAFYVTDSQGKTSNIIESSFIILPVALLLSVDVAPSMPTILKHGSQQFSATANYDDGSKIDVTTMSYWTSSDAAIATIDWAGLATGKAGGSSTISALFSGVVGATTLTVADVPLDFLTVAPQGPCIDKDATIQLTATGTYSNGMTLDISTYVSWTSSDSRIASVDSRGGVTGKVGGTAVITATSGSTQDSTTVHVLADLGIPAEYPNASGAYLGNTAIGDLNGDGRNDVTAIEYPSPSSRIAINYQNADHTLGAQQLIITDLTLKGVAVADVNNDGLAELIVAGNVALGTAPLGRVYVYAQDPMTHVLGAPQQYTLSTSSVAGMAVADLNNDGLPDIVVISTGSGSNGVVSFLFQTSTGTLASETTYSSVAVYGGNSYIGREVHVTDTNNDGMNDIVLQSGAKQLAVIKQISAGQFSTTPDYYTVQTSSIEIYSFALGDLNGDGRTDIAVGNPGNSGAINIFLQDTDGKLTGPSLQGASYEGQFEIHIADMNGDGLNDIIAVDGTLLQVLHQTADHNFPNIISYGLPSQSSGGTSIHQALSIGDVTSDGLPDFVTTWATSLYVLPHAQ